MTNTTTLLEQNLSKIGKPGETLWLFNLRTGIYHGINSENPNLTEASVRESHRQLTQFLNEHPERSVIWRIRAQQKRKKVFTIRTRNSAGKTCLIPFYQPFYLN